MRQGSHVSLWRKDIPGRERVRHRSPKRGPHLTGLSKGREATVAGVDEEREKQEMRAVGNWNS